MNTVNVTTPTNHEGKRQMDIQENLYFVENCAGETLVSQECKGMGTLYSFCPELADVFTLDEAAKLSTIHGGMIVPAT